MFPLLFLRRFINVKKKTYNIISFLIIPLAILMMGLLSIIISHFTIWAETVDKESITDKSLCTELWEIVEVNDVETSYIVYGLEDSYLNDDNYVIVIQGNSIKDIEHTVGNCYPGAYRNSYFKDAEDYRVMDMTTFYDVKEYIEKEKNKNYSYMTAEQKEQYIVDMTYKLESARIYDLSDYIGYEEEYNSGRSLAEAIAFTAILFVCGTALFIELLTAIIVKVLMKDRLK